jgi:uncharacterized protein YbbK (DUF523 family)
MKPKILISACLVGEKVKYDGGDNLISHPILQKWQEEGILIPLCPEVLGGLEVPRLPCEVVHKSGKVINQKGEDVTLIFEKGALETLKIVQENNVTMAILKARSPSCGKGMIYDGTFTGTKVEDSGFTCKFLENNGIVVFNEEEIAEAQKFWNI